MKISKVLHGIGTLKGIKENPGGFLLDLFLATLVSALIPIPFIGAVTAKYKGTILCIIGGIIGTVVLIVVAVFLALFTPIIFLFSPSNNTNGAAIALSKNAIAALNGYIDAGFTNTDAPQKNPFGGIGMLNTFTTVNYGEVEDLEIKGSPYHGVEAGIDIVPDGLYFLTNKAAQKTGLPILFSTMNGTATTNTDQYGALYIVVVNKENTIETLYIHLQQFLIGNNSQVVAGEPIGVMGSTGLSTGPHLEYQVRLNQGGSWITQNPTNFIH